VGAVEQYGAVGPTSRRELPAALHGRMLPAGKGLPHAYVD
jgi:hypothetical protein